MTVIQLKRGAQVVVFRPQGNITFRSHKITLDGNVRGKASLKTLNEQGDDGLAILIPKDQMTALCLGWLREQDNNLIDDAIYVVSEMLDATSLQCNCSAEGCDGTCTYSQAMALLSELEK